MIYLIIVLAYLAGCFTTWLVMLQNFDIHYSNGYAKGFQDAKTKGVSKDAE